MNKYNTDILKINFTKDAEIEKTNLLDIEWYLNQLSFKLKNEFSNLKDKKDKKDFIKNIFEKFNISDISERYIYDKNNSLFTNEDIFLIKNELVKKLKDKIYNESLISKKLLIVVPFITRTGILEIRNILEVNNIIKIKLISTTYDGSASALDIDGLVKLKEDFFNRVEIKIEDLFSISNTRIHSKNYIFKRDNKFSTAIIGSSNFTKTGMITGTESNIKITEFNDEELFKNIEKEFYNIWNRANLIDVLDETFLRFKEKQFLYKNHITDIYKQMNSLYTANEEKKLRDYQIKAIESIFKEINRGINKHLLVMATGTGKTFTIAKFVWEYYNRKDLIDLPKILYFAPRKEILDQTRDTFKDVIKDIYTFELYDNKNKTSGYNGEDLILTNVETISNNLEWLEQQEFNFVIFDEAHRTGAKKLNEVLKISKRISKHIIGLTATPERTDGVNVKEFFNDTYTYYLPLFDAVESNILSEFDYYYIKDDTADLTGISLAEGKGNDEKIFQALDTNKRYEFIYKTIQDKMNLNDLNIKCVMFCATIKHAKNVSDFLNSKGLKSDFLVSSYMNEDEEKINIKSEQRQEIIQNFKNGEINFLCVRDIFNEGIDIQEINNIMFLRPTQSFLVYTQQFGRGLRRVIDKRLQVFDFVNNVDMKINKKYNSFMFAKLFLNLPDKEVNKLFKENYSPVIFEKYLPSTSSLMLQKHDFNYLKSKFNEYLSNRDFYDILKQYENRKTYDDFKEYFDDHNFEIKKFYNKQTHSYLFGKDFNKNFRSAFKYINYLNSKTLIEQFIHMIETKTISLVQVINDIFLSYFKNIILKNKNLWIKRNEIIFKIFEYKELQEFLFILKYKLESNDDLIEHNISSDPLDYKNILGNQLQLRSILNSLFINDEFNPESIQTSYQSMVKNSKFKVLQSKQFISEYESKHSNFYNYDTNILTWEAQATFKSNNKIPTQIEFESNIIPTYVWYKDQDIERIYRFVGQISKILKCKVINEENDTLQYEIEIK